MSKWAKVASFLKENATEGVALVGAMLSGNVPAAVAAGAAMVQSATGTSNEQDALKQLETNPDAVIRLKELTYQNEQDVRRHIEAIELARLEDEQLRHAETQKTIRAGDTATDERIRMVRPAMAKQSWLATIAYCLGCFGVRAITGDDIFDALIAATLFAPAGAYLGLRTVDKGLAKYKAKN